MNHEPSPRERALALACAKAARRVERARRDFAVFAELVCRDEHGDAITLAPVHLAWIRHLDYCWGRNLRALILAPFGHGKCASVRQSLQLADGSMTTHGQIVGLTVPVVAYAPDGTYRRAYARGFDNGPRRVWRLTFDSGRACEVTDEHPFLTLGGWMEAQHLKVDRFVAAANHVDGLGSQRLLDGEARMLGFLIADGSLTGGQMAMTKYEPAVRAEVIATAVGLGFGANEQPVKAKKRADAVNVSFTEGDDRHGLGGPRQWARAHRIMGCGSYEKRTPTAIFTAPDGQIAEYLGSYFSCDGSIDAKGRTGVELYSVNRHLLDDAQALLARLGIVSRVRPKLGRYNGAAHHSWRLTVAWSYIKLFAEKIRLVGEKSCKLAELCRTIDAHTRLGNGDLVSLEYRQFLTRSAHWHRQRGVIVDQWKPAGHRQTGTERAIVRRAAEAEGNEYLLKMTAPELFWDRIVAKEDLGVQPTVGVDVDEHHTYLAGGMIVHNTSTLAVPLVTWLVGRDVGVRIKLVTNDDPGASKRVSAAKRIIETPVYRSVFPHAKRGDRWTDHELFMKRPAYATVDPTVHARGIFTTGIGGREEILIFDDIVDQKNSTDQAQRKRVLELAEGTWLSRLEPDGKVMGIGTAWHAADAYHVWMHRKGWCTLVQRINADCTAIEQEVFGALDGQYPVG